MPATVSLEIPPRSPYVGVVRLAIASLARTAGVEEEMVEDLKIAVSEACANAVLAHEEAGSEDAVSVDWTETEERLIIEINDRGTTVEDLTGGDPDDSQGFSSRLTMSIALLESLVDECRISPRDGGGTTTHLSLGRV